ncbi:Putative zinc-finger [Hathewaya proteolytica DSM 3090]|uniref:Putative zinc-finger n=1 Tax=Hathewaya proteolytica DSM 3090 TaxID=1121331 RepID=A0A1M6M0B5_9CLOT|nr:zf-HC2 domain-containing protein [Hathewaya proteolytica]SHJ76790.1 Putative zinc-finger [Hathewaya proteolytica DSM 3090]
MKDSCEIIRDLLPLYHDEVCSEETKLMVEEHLKGCISCSKVLEDISYNIDYPSLGLDLKENADPAEALRILKKQIKRKREPCSIKSIIICVFIIILFAVTVYKVFFSDTAYVERMVKAFDECNKFAIVNTVEKNNTNNLHLYDLASHTNEVFPSFIESVKRPIFNDNFNEVESKYKYTGYDIILYHDYSQKHSMKIYKTEENVKYKILLAYDNIYSYTDDSNGLIELMQNQE